MNIFVIPSVYPWRKNLNAGIFTYEQCQALAKNGHDITILDSSGVNYKDWFNYSCFHTERSEEGKTLRFTQHTRNLITSRLPILSTLLCRITTNRLYKMAVEEKGNPDIIIAHFSLSAGFCSVELSRKWNVPFIVVEHYSLYYKEKLSRRYRYLLSKEISNCARFICVSDHLKDAILNKCYTDKISVVPNMISDIFHYYPPKPTTTFKFFSAGNLNSNKRFELLIDSFCRAFRKDDHVELYIAGSGPDRVKLEEKVIMNDRTHQIKLLGNINKSEMLEQYIYCHCFVLLSKKETFGIVYREAMGVGRPVVATRNGGVEENWDDRFGVLIDDDSEESIAQALVGIKNTYDEYDTEFISSMCRSRYSEEVIIGQIEEIINSVRGND